MTTARGQATTEPATHVADRAPRAGWAALVGAIVAAATLAATRMAMSDDAYITLAFARNVALRGEWAVTPGLWSNTATSPLQVIAVAAATVLVRDAVIGAAVVTVAAAAVLSAAVSATSARVGGAWWAGPLAVALLALTPVMQATTGLESWTAGAVAGVALWAAVERRWGLLGVAAGLLVLARPDLGVVAVAAVVLAGRGWPRALGAAVATVVPVLATSLIVFGSLVPDTLVWKQSRTEGAEHSAFGSALPMLWQWWPAATGLSGALVAVGLVTLIWWARRAPTSPVVILGGALLVVHPLAMWALAPPAHAWYHAPTLTGAALLLALAAAQGRRVAQVAAGCLLAAGVAFTASADWSVPPMHWNGASAEQYRAVAELVPDGAVVETAHGEVGAIAWWCDTRCTVVDPLSDPGRMSEVVGAARDRSAAVRAMTPLWQPTMPTDSDVVTSYSEQGGVPVWSGFGARWARIAVLPAP